MQKIKGISQIISDFDVFIVDFWGVLFEQTEAREEALDALNKIKSYNKKIFLLSNSPRRAVDMIDFLYSINIKKGLFDGVLTSGEVAYNDLIKREDAFIKSFGKKYFYIGGKMCQRMLDDIGYDRILDLAEADFLFDTGVYFDDDAIDVYEPLLNFAIKRDIPMICTNSDRVIPRGDVNNIGPGEIAMRYQNLGGRVKFYGKPQKDVFAYCIEAVPNIPKDRILMIGDTFDTDIVGSNSCGIKNLLSAGGTHKKEIDFSTEDSFKSSINETSRFYGIFPDYVISKLAW